MVEKALEGIRAALPRRFVAQLNALLRRRCALLPGRNYNQRGESCCESGEYFELAARGTDDLDQQTDLSLPSPQFT